jgi:hypothetical protein
MVDQTQIPQRLVNITQSHRSAINRMWFATGAGMQLIQERIAASG